MRQVIITPAEEGGYYATVPSLPGCISQGETWEDTIANIREAIGLFVECILADGEPIPEDHLDRVLVNINV